MHALTRSFAALSVLAVVAGILLSLTFTSMQWTGRNTTPSSTSGIPVEISVPPPSTGQRHGYTSVASILELFARRLEALRVSLSISTGVPRTITPIIVGGLPLLEKSRSQPSPQYYSGTNVQVEGVDEEDVVKNDERYIYVATGGEVRVFDTVSKKTVSRILLPENYQVHGLYLDKGYLVVIAGSRGVLQSITLLYTGIALQHGSTLVVVYNVSNPSTPIEVGRAVISGIFTGSRLSSGILYVVSSSSAYIIGENGSIKPFIPSINGEPVEDILIPEGLTLPLYMVTVYSLNLTSMDSSNLTVVTGSVDWIYMSRERLYIASKYPVYMVLDVFFQEALVNASIMSGAFPEDVLRDVSSYASRGDYNSAYRRIVEYLNSRSMEEASKLIDEVNRVLSNLIPRVEDSTVFYMVDVNGTSLAFRGSIKVKGLILDQFAMEEMNLDGRRLFITATTLTTAFFKAYYTRYQPPMVVGDASNLQVNVVECVESRCVTIPVFLNASRMIQQPVAWGLWYMLTGSDTSNLVAVVDLSVNKTVAVLSDLAPGERIYAARLVKNMFYLVTYRRIDPLYAIDLSNPENPRVLGYLKTPGFSEYLHPVSGDRLLGIGLGGNGGLKISLFDVSRPEEPRESAYIELPGWSPVFSDHHAFTWDPLRGNAYIPYSYTTSGVLVVKVGDSSLHLVKILQHPGAIRAVYIGGSIYTVSWSSIAEWSADTMQLIGEYKLG